MFRFMYHVFLAFLVFASFWLCPYVMADADSARMRLFRTYFNCAPCVPQQCNNPVGCELIKEPGICGCCMTCARQQGELCGVHTERCGAGLQCQARDGFEYMWKGKGRCVKVSRRDGAVPKFSAAAKRMLRI